MGCTPELPARLFEAFVAARDAARRAGVLSVSPEGTPPAGFVDGEPLPYGAGAVNRAAAEAAAQMAHDQGLVGRIYTPDEIFGAPLSRASEP